MASVERDSLHETLQPAEPDWYERAVHDVYLLEVAAKRLRMLGFFWLFWFLVSMTLSFVLMGFGIVKAMFVFGVLGVFMLGLTGLYFGLARYVATGRRWAIALALFLVTIFATMLVLRVIFADRLHVGSAIIDVMYLVATLNLIKSLVQAWTAAKRLHKRTALIRQNAPLDA